MKMALQYQRGVGRPERTRLLTVRGGYHGDTFGCMSVCDPVGGMHSMFAGVLPAAGLRRPPAGAEAGDVERDLGRRRSRASRPSTRDELAGIIVEPLLQGAGGMHAYPAECLRVLREVADEHGLVLVFDEIATGFGRTGTLFAADAAGVTPDIICLGKALTGGYLTLAAVLCTAEVARGLSALASPASSCTGRPTWATRSPARWRWPASTCCRPRLGSDRSRRINDRLTDRAGSAAARCRASPTSGRSAPSGWSSSTTRSTWSPRPTPRCSAGVWLRPFRDLIYTMPPYVISDDELDRLLARHRRGGRRPDEWLGAVARRAGRRARGGRADPPAAAARADDPTSSTSPATTTSGSPATRRSAAAAADAALHLGRRRRCLAAGHRAPSTCTPSSRPSSPTSSGSPPRWCSPPATTPTSPWSPRSPTATRSSSPTRTSMPPWSTPPGSRAPGSTVVPHSDVGRGARPRWPSAGSAERALVLAESVYSVLGDAAPLTELAELCAAYDALLVVDEAHGLGVARAAAWSRGPGSPGTRRRRHRDPVQVAGQPGRRGARVRRRCVEHLVNRARPFIFDTGLAPASTAAALAALRGAARPGPSCPTLVRDRVARRWPTPSASRRPTARCCRSRCRRRRRRSPRRPRPWPRASGSAASVRRRCPTASPGCGSRRAPASPSADWDRAVDVLVAVVKEHQ